MLTPRCSGFDDSWVQTPGSIDLTIGAWNALAEPTDSKEDVIQNLQWSFSTFPLSPPPPGHANLLTSASQLATRRRNTLTTTETKSTRPDCVLKTH